MPRIAVLDHDTVLAAVSPEEAIERVREAFVASRATSGRCRRRSICPALPTATSAPCRCAGEGLAALKWVTSFPGNPRRNLPTVTGILLVSDADNGRAGRAASTRAR